MANTWIIFLSVALVLGQGLAIPQTIQPLYGVLTQPLNIPSPEIAMSRPSELSMSYVMKVYFQMLTSGGAMTVAIPYDLPMRKLVEVLPFLTGILLPDGFESDLKGKEYSTKLAFLYNCARNRNDDGFFFSIVAIGKGFRELMKASLGKDEGIQDCSQPNLHVHGKVTLDLVELKSTNMLKSLSQSEMEYALSSEETVPFNHNCSIPVDRFMSSELASQYHLVGTSTTKEGGMNFVSLVEHRKYPFVGMQFNPEVSAYNIGGGHPKDRRTIRFYRDLVGQFLLDDPKRLSTKIEDLPLAIRNMLMYKDMPIHGLKDQDQIYLYRRWAAGRDIDMPN